MGEEENRLEISLNNLVDVQKFVTLASTCNNLVTVKSSIYCVDGKSLMGILSLDLSHSLTVYFESTIDMPKFTEFSVGE